MAKARAYIDGITRRTFLCIIKSHNCLLNMSGLDHDDLKYLEKYKCVIDYESKNITSNNQVVIN